MPRAAILFADDDRTISSMVGSMLRRKGHDVTTVSSGPNAMKMLDQKKYDVAVFDEAIPGSSVVDMIGKLKDIAPGTRVLLLTDHNTRLSTIEMVRDDIYSFHMKPINFNELHETIQRVIEEGQQTVSEAPATNRAAQPPKSEAAQRVKGVTGRYPRGNDPVRFLGESKSIQLVRQQVTEVSPTDLTVLIRGESGVGKGIVARMLHAQSGRGRINELVSINCPAIPETLIESELFGHEAGAFTGADHAKPGRLELASKGTIFLDEIAEIPPNIQVKLLQVIEQKEIYHLGGKRPIHVDVRFVTATNASLEHAMSQGQFRADLFYRINEFSIYIPPLRERIEDIPILVEHFVRTYAEKFSKPVVQVPSDVMSLLMQYNWPGNVRELETNMRRCVLSSNFDSVISQIKPRAEEARRATNKSLLNQNEIQTILAVLTEVRWNQRRAAKVLGISYSALRRRIDKYGLKNSSAQQYVQSLAGYPGN